MNDVILVSVSDPIDHTTDEAILISVRDPRGLQGLSATIKVGTVTSVSNDQPAVVTNVGTPEDAIFDFEIPQGPIGLHGMAATIEVGSVTTLAPDQPAKITNVGTLEDAIFKFEIPQGIPGVDPSSIGDTSTNLVSIFEGALT